MVKNYRVERIARLLQSWSVGHASRLIRVLARIILLTGGAVTVDFEPCIRTSLGPAVDHTRPFDVALLHPLDTPAGTEQGSLAMVVGGGNLLFLRFGLACGLTARSNPAYFPGLSRENRPSRPFV
jgi:hypothetical protein